MIKVSVMYPYRDSAKFDMEYYRVNHVRLLHDKLGSALKGMSVDEGIGGGEPGSVPAYVAMGHLYFDSVDAFQNAFGPHADAIVGDIQNYTDIEPVIVISNVHIL